MEKDFRRKNRKKGLGGCEHLRMSGNLLDASIILWVYFYFSFVETIVPAFSSVPVLSWEFVTGSFLLGSFILVL